MANEQEKEAAARASLRFVRDGDIVGLGTGSTAAYAVRFLGERVQAGLKIRGIPTSIHTQEQAASLGIPRIDRKSTRLNSSHLGISYAVFCLKKKKQLTISKL